MSNSDDVLIKVENVSKKFCRSLKRSMFYGIEDIARDFLHLKNTSDHLRPEEFWAVDNVSFEVKRGECLGIIGRNGAGKSTLLKMLNGIYMPDKGKITIKGKVGALIEVGAGFHPMLTGRENVYVNGAILGMSKREIDKKFDEIVAFAELEEFIDMPVKHYSSGMYVRLGFAIAIQMKPDVLVLDEILAVGDMGFRAKCYNIIAKTMKESAVIFVSHNLDLINRTCNRCIFIKKGNIYAEGRAKDIAKFYITNEYEIIKNIYLEPQFKLISFECNKHEISIGDDIQIAAILYSPENIETAIFKIHFITQSGDMAAEYITSKKLNKGRNVFGLELINVRLFPQFYSISLVITENVRHLVWLRNEININVKGECFGYPVYQIEGRFIS